MTIDESKALLKEYFPKGSTAYTILRKVSPSGMYRNISVHSIINDKPTWLSYHVARVTGFPYKDKTSAVGVGGCGMDMGFHMVYTLASVLYGDGYALKERYI